MRAPLEAVCVIPGSKSLSNRALVLAALSSGPSRLSGVLRARDTELMIGALRALGVGIEISGDEVVVTPPEQFIAGGVIDCGLAGTVMRFVPPIAALANGTTGFIGDPHASQRPMAPILSGLRQLGADCSADALPFELSSTGLIGRRVEIDASGSSQFISALLLSAARFPQGIELVHTGDSVPSQPHIDMTVEMLRDRGVQVTQPTPTSWSVAPGPITAADHTIEPDLTNAAAFLIAGALTRGRVSVPGWPTVTTQPGVMIREVLEAMGARTELVDGVLTATADTRLHGVDLDLHAASELTPVVAAAAALASGTTTIRGVAHIRGHETDRLAAIRQELTSLGVPVVETDDGLVITGQDPAALRPPRVLRAYADHRMAHLAAVRGLLVEGIRLDDISCVSKTMPDFADRWAAMIKGGR